MRQVSSPNQGWRRTVQQSGRCGKQSSEGGASSSSDELTHQSPGRSTLFPTLACCPDPSSQRPDSKAEEDAGSGAQSCAKLTGSKDSPTQVADGHLHPCSLRNSTTPSYAPSWSCGNHPTQTHEERVILISLADYTVKREGISFSWWAFNCKSQKNTCNFLVCAKKKRNEKVDSTVPGLTSGLSQVYVIHTNDIKCNSNNQSLSSLLTFSLPSNSSNITDP